MTPNKETKRSNFISLFHHHYCVDVRQFLYFQTSYYVSYAGQWVERAKDVPTILPYFFIANKNISRLFPSFIFFSWAMSQGQPCYRKVSRSHSSSFRPPECKNVKRRSVKNIISQCNARCIHLKYVLGLLWGSGVLPDFKTFQTDKLLRKCNEVSCSSFGSSDSKAIYWIKIWFNDY